MPRSKIPNSIVLFLNCHGSESGNLVGQTTSTGAGFYENENHCLNDLQENVKITLSSAASVSAYGSQVSNPVGIKKTFVEYAQDIQVNDNTSFRKIITALKAQTNHDFYKDVVNKTIGEEEKIFFIIDYKKVDSQHFMTSFVL
uniref:Uncharacterized protein n=1 Tax=viral metagenome TaxID=1070528 RepID=A0A6C0I3P0_9ZZZZ